MVSHLQKDLQTEKQDKEHIQNELNDALVILKKPATAEMGTQTDLTAEQISQMEADIVKYQQDIKKEQNKISALQTKLVNLRSELKTLQGQAQANPTEKQLLVYVN